MAERKGALQVFQNKELQPYTLVDFISENLVQKRVLKLGQQISQDYKGHELTLVASLKGASVFLADLMRSIDLPNLQIGFVEAGSYGDNMEPGELNIVRDFEADKLNGRNVMIVEDIADRGHTLAGLIQAAKNNPKLSFSSLRVAALLSKSSNRQVEVPLQYVGFTIEDKFVVGYGLDYQQRHRHLRDIKVVNFI